MKLNKKELWTIYIALNSAAAYNRVFGKETKKYEKLADKIEKELLK